MNSFELYVFFLCMIVLVSLTAMFSFFVYKTTTQRLALTEHGLLDEKIRRYLTKIQNKKVTKWGKLCHFIERFLSITVCLVFCVVLIVVLISSCVGNTRVKTLPAIKVVASTSMAEKYENNKYLFENNLDNQLQLFDVIMLHELPPEEELKQYDVVVYEHISGSLLIHRIVGIEPPNEEHPDEYHFLLQGDAVHYPDTFPVRYSQMKSIWLGERIPNVGSFVYFMQSPAGMICLLLIVLGMISMPIVDKRVDREEYNRARLMVENGEFVEDVLNVFSAHKKAEKGGGVRV